MIKEKSRIGLKKFDDFFEELANDIDQTHGLKALVVTSPCPEFVQSPTPSILYSRINGVAVEAYFECIELLENKDVFQLVEASINGFGEGKFPVALWFDTEKKIDEESLRLISEKAEKVLSETLYARILELRDYIVAMSLQTTDVSSFFHKAITEGLKTFFDFEAASAFFYDYQNDTLILGATTGIREMRAGGLRRADIKYYDSSKSWVRKCFETAAPISEWAPRGEYLVENTFGEDVELIRNRLFLPINVRANLVDRLAESYGVEERNLGKTGVLRIVNPQRNKIFNPISLIDYHFLEHFSEYIAVLGARYIRVLNIIHEQDKSTHGFVTDLSTLRLRVQLFRRQFTEITRKVSSLSREEQVRSALVELDGITTLFERSFFAVQDGMAFQLHTVAQFTDGVVGAVAQEGAVCERPYVEVVMRIFESRIYISQNYGRKAAWITFGGGQKASNQFIRMPKINVPQKTIYLAVRNLVENSIKYTPRKEVPQIDFDWSEEGGKLYFDVTDQGIGIHPADAPSLFREGFRARSALGVATRGNGLGLCVSKRALQAFGGDLMYLSPSSNGKGAVFRVVVPTIK